jgi:hypothetical protein
MRDLSTWAHQAEQEEQAARAAQQRYIAGERNRITMNGAMPDRLTPDVDARIQAEAAQQFPMPQHRPPPVGAAAPAAGAAQAPGAPPAPQSGPPVAPAQPQGQAPAAPVPGQRSDASDLSFVESGDPTGGTQSGITLTDPDYAAPTSPPVQMAQVPRASPPSQMPASSGRAPLPGPSAGYFSILRNQESAGQNNPPPNPRSSAAGPYQFLRNTWLGRPDAPGIYADLPGADRDLLQRAWRGDEQAQQQILNLRTDQNTALAGAQEYARQTAAYFRSGGRNVAPTDTNFALAHFLGPAGATRFIGAFNRDPSMPVSRAVSAAALQANPDVFYRNGREITVGELMQTYRDRYGDGTSAVTPSGGPAAAARGASTQSVASAPAATDARTPASQPMSVPMVDGRVDMGRLDPNQIYTYNGAQARFDARRGYFVPLDQGQAPPASQGSAPVAAPRSPPVPAPFPVPLPMTTPEALSTVPGGAETGPMRPPPRPIGQQQLLRLGPGYNPNSPIPDAAALRGAAAEVGASMMNDPGLSLNDAVAGVATRYGLGPDDILSTFQDLARAGRMHALQGRIGVTGTAIAPPTSVTDASAPQPLDTETLQRLQVAAARRAATPAPVAPPLGLTDASAPSPSSSPPPPPPPPPPFAFRAFPPGTPAGDIQRARRIWSSLPPDQQAETWRMPPQDFFDWAQRNQVINSPDDYAVSTTTGDQ